MDFTPLNFLYISLSIFTIVIWTLLSIILVKVIRLMRVAEEIVWYYENIKQILSVYSQIPLIIKEKIKSFFVSEEKKQEEK
jgi:hypothetical protein